MTSSIEILQDQSQRTGVPVHTLEALERYVEDRLPPGGFLMAVLEHDLFESFARADDMNRRAMEQIVAFIYNELPSACHGSQEKVNNWLVRGGVGGLPYDPVPAE